MRDYRPRRLYRVTGTWPDGSVRVRHYMTKKAAEERAARFRSGSAAFPAREAAETVTVEASEPIIWLPS